MPVSDVDMLKPGLTCDGLNLEERREPSILCVGMVSLVLGLRSDTFAQVSICTTLGSVIDHLYLVYYALSK